MNGCLNVFMKRWFFLTFALQKLLVVQLRRWNSQAVESTNLYLSSGLQRPQLSSLGCQFFSTWLLLCLRGPWQSCPVRNFVSAWLVAAALKIRSDPWSMLCFLCQPVGNRPLPAPADIFRAPSWRHLHPLPPQLQLRCHGVIWSHHSDVGCSNWQLRPHFYRAQGQD